MRRSAANGLKSACAAGVVCAQDNNRDDHTPWFRAVFTRAGKLDEEGDIDDDKRAPSSEDESDYGESLYEYLLDAQERITPETCATAIAVVAGHDFYKRRKPRRCFRLLLVGGPAFCELYMSDFRLAMQISKLI